LYDFINCGVILHIIEDSRRTGFVKISALLGELEIESIKESRDGNPHIIFVFPNEWKVYISKEKRMKSLFDIFEKYLPKDKSITFDEFFEKFYSMKYKENELIDLLDTYLPLVRIPIVFNCNVAYDKLFAYELVDEQSAEVPYWQQRKVVSCGFYDLKLSFSEGLNSYIPQWVAPLGTIELEDRVGKKFDSITNQVVVNSGGNLGTTLFLYHLEGVIESNSNRIILSRIFSAFRDEDAEDKFKNILELLLKTHEESKQVFKQSCYNVISFESGKEVIMNSVEKSLKSVKHFILKEVIREALKKYSEFHNIFGTRISTALTLSHISNGSQKYKISDKSSKRLQTEAYEVLKN
jgi:hypothetical protein